MSSNRMSEKLGWLLGWSGGFAWVLILAVIRLIQGVALHALVGGVLVVFAGMAILLFAPWRYPTQPYWALMAPVYLLFFLSVAWYVWMYGGFSRLGLNLWSLFLLFPLLLPVFLAGKRRWIDVERDIA